MLLLHILDETSLKKFCTQFNDRSLHKMLVHHLNGSAVHFKILFVELILNSSIAMSFILSLLKKWINRS